MHWITRERIRVGRIGCAWLITRFIDPAAELHFVAGPQFEAETAKFGATPFHVEGSGLAREGDRSSFEVVLARYDLAGDPALELLGQIVNTADIRQSPFKRPEGAGLKAITEGLLPLYADDHALFVVGGQIYDALYAYCEEQVRRGKFPAAPAVPEE